jgi:hypothetical protein
MSNVLSVPEDLQKWRERLFSVEEPLTLTAEEYDTYWPYVNNVWHFKDRNPPRKNDGAQVSFFSRLRGYILSPVETYYSLRQRHTIVVSHALKAGQKMSRPPTNPAAQYSTASSDVELSCASLSFQTAGERLCDSKTPAIAMILTAPMP